VVQAQTSARLGQFEAHQQVRWKLSTGDMMGIGQMQMLVTGWHTESFGERWISSRQETATKLGLKLEQEK